MGYLSPVSAQVQQLKNTVDLWTGIRGTDTTTTPPTPSTSHAVENPRISQPSITPVLHARFQPTKHQVVLYCLFFKNLHINGPAQFRPVLFEGQLYFYHKNLRQKEVFCIYNVKLLLLSAEKIWEMLVLGKAKSTYLSFFPEPFLQLGI